MTRSSIGSTLAFALAALGTATPLAAQTDTSTSRSFWAGYVGAGLQEFQFIAGGQAWLRLPVKFAYVVPEAAIGHGTSILGGVGLHLAPGGHARPYAGLGVHYLWYETESVTAWKEVVFTPKAGILADTPALRGLLGESSVGWMLEYQGVDWFALHRLLIGARWRF